VIRRAVGLPGGWHLGREIPVETTPQLHWTAACDEVRGLAVVAPSLRETAVRDLPDRPIALTLFRSTRRTVLTDGEPGGQLEGTMDFDYWLAPVKEGFGRRRLFDLARQCASGIRSLALGAPDFESVREAPGEPLSFFALDGPAVLTSARIISDHVELRVFNPEEVPVTSTIRPGAGHRPHSWARVDLEHRPVSGQETGDIVLDLRAKEIATIRLVFEN
jgi:alpha-mannosidase/mannosylglycerate hydrolase